MDLIRYFEKRLAALPRNAGNETPVVVIVGHDSPNQDAAAEAAARIGAKVILAPDGIRLHEHKRLLNTCRCDCLLYSSGCEGLAYRIKNDGVTCVHHFICLDPDIYDTI